MNEPLEELEPTALLNDLVHQKNRLGILTILHEGRRVEFSYLRDALGLTAGNLSQHLSVLEGSGLIRLEKGYDGRKGRTWASNTRAGTRALREEINALRAIVARVDGPSG